MNNMVQGKQQLFSKLEKMISSEADEAEVNFLLDSLRVSSNYWLLTNKIKKPAETWSDWKRKRAGDWLLFQANIRHSSPNAYEISPYDI